MATSGVSTLSMTGQEIVRDAFNALGLVAPNEPLAAEDQALALRELNKLVVAFMTQGMHLWSQDTQYLPLVAAQAAYEVGSFVDDAGPPPTHTLSLPRPVRLLSVWLRDGNGSDTTPLTAIGRDDYERLPAKTAPGQPAYYWYNRLVTTGVLTLHPAPDAASVSAYPTLYYSQQRPLYAFSTAANDADFPLEWGDALVYGLAERLLPIYPETLSRATMISALALRARQAALWQDREEASTFFGVDNAV